VKVTSQTPRASQRAGAKWLAAAVAFAGSAALVVHVVSWVPAVRAVGSDIGVPPVQSVALLLLAVTMMLVTRWRNRRTRLAAAGAVLAAALLLMVTLSLPFEHVGQNFMGDGQDFAGHREKFEINIPLAGGKPELHFKAHLGDALLAAFDRAYGPSPASAGRAYQTVSRVGGLLYVFEIATVLIVLRGSRRACRFAALALAAPVAIGFFGYYELGYLAVSAAAFPLLIIGVRCRRPVLTGAAAGFQGLHAALHGFGLLGIAGGVAGVVAAARTWRHRVSALVSFGMVAAVAYLGWILVYQLAWGVSVVADPASSNIAVRAWTTPFYFDRRLVHPLTSFDAAAEIGVTSLAVGVPVLVLAVLRARRLTSIAAPLAYALPGLLFLIAWWPSLGVSHDMDLLLGAFGGIIAAAWVCSRRHAHATVALAVLAAVHVAFWAGIADRSLSRIWLGE
jgi:hypothetical protein